MIISDDVSLDSWISTHSLPPGIVDVSVGVEQGADVDRLTSPEVSLNSPVEC